MLCTARHREDSRALGKPINARTAYDYAPPRRVERLRRRTVAPHHHRPQPRRPARSASSTTSKLRVSYGKVAEYQARGVVHFHALLRLDLVDPTDPDLRPATPADDHRRATSASCSPAPSPPPATPRPDYPQTSTAWTLTWGTQLDIRPVASSATGEITSEAVAAYLAKYATKSTETTGHLSQRITVETIDHYADPDTHTGRLIAHAWTLGTPPADLLDPDQRDRFRADLRPAAPVGAHAAPGIMRNRDLGDVDEPC